MLRFLVFALVGLTTLTAIAPASAQTADDEVTGCQALILQVRANTVTTEFSNPKDQAGLISKLDAATAKLAQGKPADALQALNQFAAKVDLLVLQGKLDPTSATLLLEGEGDIAGVNDAITCISTPDV